MIFSFTKNFQLTSGTVMDVINVIKGTQLLGVIVNDSLSWAINFFSCSKDPMLG